MRQENDVMEWGRGVEPAQLLMRLKVMNRSALDRQWTLRSRVSACLVSVLPADSTSDCLIRMIDQLVQILSQPNIPLWQCSLISFSMVPLPTFIWIISKGQHKLAECYIPTLVEDCGK